MKIIPNPAKKGDMISCVVCYSKGFVDVYVNTLIENVWTRINAHNVKALLWACLIREDPDLKIEEVGGMISLQNYLDVHTALKKAVENAMPEPQEVKKKVSRKSRAG